MLLKVDAKGIEWRVKTFLSRDEIAIKEILNGVDQHLEAQKEFNLPSRLIAKVFNFRMIYADAFGDQGFRKPAYSYAKDPDFNWISRSERYWTERVEAFFGKYAGMFQHGQRLIHEAKTRGQIENVDGTIYPFSPDYRGGIFQWPHSDILNYPVQGLAARIVMLARLVTGRRIRRLGLNKKVLPFNTVHDSLEIDIDRNPELCYNICIMLEDIFQELPKTFEWAFGTPFDIPLAGEVFFGNNLLKMAEFKRKNGRDQFGYG